MTRIFLIVILLLTLNSLSAQYVYTIKADSVKITNCDSSELIIENHTQGVKGGFLYNKGNGRTEFRKVLVALNDSLYLFGGDTLNINLALKYARPTTLANVLTQGNISIPGTAAQPPIIMAPGVLTTIPQPGALEYDQTGLYITDSSGKVRHDLVRTDRLYKINTGIYDNGSTAYTPYTFNLIGWDVDYSVVNSSRYLWDSAHTMAATMDIEITLPAGIPAGLVLTAKLQDSTVYTLTVSEAITQNTYVIGTIHANQDLSDPTVFYVKGARETVSASGLVNSSNAALRIYPASFKNPTLTFDINNGGVNYPSIKIAATYTVDKKPYQHWLDRNYNHR